MCGICGQVGGIVRKARLRAAMQKLKHRGPDQEGWWQRPSVALGHRRLSIIDLSEAGRQPMSNEDGTVWLVFNGEIYNFVELRRDLERQHCFISHTDSEVLIHGYEQWGIDGVLARIRGMFAFALWDDARQTLHIARDHLGKKPLYYCISNGRLLFASSLPALLELLGETPEVSRPAILDYLSYKSVPAPQTIFVGVHKLLPAHRLEFGPNGHAEQIRFWRPDFAEKDELSESEWLDRIDAVLRDAVRDRLVSDVPLGAFLSGGVDSSLIVALMTQVSGRPVTTISMGFEEQGFDELPFARQVAERYGADHHEYVLKPQAAHDLPALTFFAGEPFADAAVLPTYYLAQAARQKVKVILTGDGGDEAFAGYPSAQAVALAYRLRRVPGMSGGQVAALLHSIEQLGLGRVRSLRWVAEIARGVDGNYVFDPVGRGTFRFRADQFLGPALQDDTLGAEPDRLYHALWRDAGVTDWVDRALYVDLLTNLPNTFLFKTDIATMAHGLEARSPFLDLRVVELACRIPSRTKLARLESKHLLKRLAARYLPYKVIYRRKHGFFVPVSQWLRDDLGDVLGPLLLSPAAQRRNLFQTKAVEQLIVEHRHGKADHAQRLWLLLNLELWFRMFIDRDLAPDDDLSGLKSKRSKL